MMDKRSNFAIAHLFQPLITATKFRVHAYSYTALPGIESYPQLH